MSGDGPTRREVPVWRQALEGIGLVVAISLVVALTGLILSIVVAVLF